MSFDADRNVHLSLLSSMCMCSTVFIEKSIAGRQGIDITEIHDWTGDIVTTLGDQLETGIPQQVGTHKRLEEVQVRRHRDGFGTPAHAQLTIDTADLGLNGIGGDDQHLGYLRVGLPSY